MRIVYIDMQNVHKSTEDMWRLIDRSRFYVYLTQKYKVEAILIFVWYIQKYQHMYEQLTKLGYKCVFKEVVIRPDWSIKWDVDIDIAIWAMKHIHQKIVTEAYLVSGDADYNTLIDEWVREWVFAKLIVPNVDKTMHILRKSAWGKLQSLTDIQHLIEKQKD